jgi:hypothetical protein
VAVTDNLIQSSEPKSDATQLVLRPNVEGNETNQTDLESNVAETIQDNSSEQNDKQLQTSDEIIESNSPVEQMKMKTDDAADNDSFLEYTVDESVGVVTKDSLDEVDKPILVTGSIDT